MLNSTPKPAWTQPASKLRPTEIEHGKLDEMSPELNALPSGSETAVTQTCRPACRASRRGLVAIAALAGAALATPALGQQPESGLTLAAGYRSVDVGEQKFVHDTHHDDWFLPAAGVPGAAGKTEVGGLLHFGTLGVGYDMRLGRSWSAGFEIGALLGGERDEHQNDNDHRPPAQGAFVYSEARVGIFAAAGLSYHLKRWSLGAEATLAGVFVDHGWDRFDSDESEAMDFVLAPSCGPKLGYAMGHNWRAEVTVQFGRSVTAAVLLSYRF
jgi:hypothetical protein